MDASEDFYIRFIFSALVNLGVISFIALALYDFRKYLWKTVDAVITRSEVRSYSDSDNDQMFEPDIEYKYTYNSQQYTSNKIGFAIYSSSSPKAAENLIGHFALDWKVRAFVNPKNPSESTLKPGLGVYQLSLLGFLVFGFYFWVPIGWFFWGTLGSK